MDAVALGSAAFFAMFLMPLVSLLKKQKWATEVKYLISMGAAVIAAIGGAAVDGNIGSFAEFIAYLGTAQATINGLYTMYFKNTKLNETLEDME